MTLIAWLSPPLSSRGGGLPVKSAPMPNEFCEIGWCFGSTTALVFRLHDHKPTAIAHFAGAGESSPQEKITTHAVRFAEKKKHKSGARLESRKMEESHAYMGGNRNVDVTYTWPKRAETVARIRKKYRIRMCEKKKRCAHED